MGDPPDVDRPAPVRAVYGGGGLFGIGFTLGIAEALDDGGFGLHGFPALGTSAGSWAAAALAMRIRFLDALELVEERVPRIPDPRPGRLREVAAEVFGDDTHAEGVRIVACSLPRLRREVFDATEHPVADLVAASSAVPGMLAPHRIGRRRYVDGGVRSVASVDLAGAAHWLLVVLPMSGPMFGPAGRFVQRGTRRELREWEQHHPYGRLVVVRPSEEIAALASRPDQLFDPERARRCYELAYAEGLELAARWQDVVEEHGWPATVPSRPSSETPRAPKQSRRAS